MFYKCFWKGFYCFCKIHLKNIKKWSPFFFSFPNVPQHICVLQYIFRIKIYLLISHYKIKHAWARFIYSGSWMFLKDDYILFDLKAFYEHIWKVNIMLINSKNVLQIIICSNICWRFLLSKWKWNCFLVAHFWNFVTK